MKHIQLFAVLFLAGLAASCGSKGDKAQPAAPQPEALALQGPQFSESELCRTDTVLLGGHRFTVTLKREPDTALPTVRDENDVEFYDNRVEVSVTCDGSSWASRVFTKADFDAQLPAEERPRAVLQGMAHDADLSSASAIVLGAQLGQPGLDGEGPAFSVRLLQGGGVSIQPVSAQVTTRDDMEASLGD